MVGKSIKVLHYLLKFITMHTIPGRVLPSLGGHGPNSAAGPLSAVPGWSSSVSSSHATHRRLHPAGSAVHASLPKFGVVAVPDESLATSGRLPPQQQQQSPAAQAVLGVNVRRTRVLQHLQAPTELQQQLSQLQQATEEQQRQLWQAQSAQQTAGRDWASTADGQHKANRRTHQSPTTQRQQQQQYQQQQQQDGWMQQFDRFNAAPPKQLERFDGAPAKQLQLQRPQQQQYKQQQQLQEQQPQSFRQHQSGHQQQRLARPGQQQGRQQQQQSSSWQQQQQQQQQQGSPSWSIPGQTNQWDSQQQQQQQQQRPAYQERRRPPHQQQWDASPSSHSSRTHSSSNLTNHMAAEDASPSSTSTSTSNTLRFTYGLQQDWSLPTGMAVTYLGSSSGAPSRDRNVSCTVLRVPDALYLVDCGEGSSRQAKLTGLQLEQIDTLFVTHLHGDHCFGIGTMLVSMCKARKAAAAAAAAAGSNDSSSGIPGPDSPDALRVVGPPRLGELLSSMLFIAGIARQLDQPLYITEFVEDVRDAHDWQPLLPPATAPPSAAGSGCLVLIRRLAPTQQLQQQQWPPGLKHRLDTTGLNWEVQNKRYSPSPFYAKVGLLWHIPCRKVRVTAAQLQHRVPCWGYVFDELLDSTPQGSSGSGSSSSGSSEYGRRVVLLGDTVDSRGIAPVACGADLVSHEATFAAGMEGKAAMAQHSTAWMAGQFAWAVQAKALVLTHFSARYEGSRANNKYIASDTRGSRGYDSSGGDREGRESEERSIKALQREAADQYGLGQVLLAIDLLTAHVPNQQPEDEAAE